MGNLFSSSTEKEWKKLTKKNTKANRDVVTQPGLDEEPPVTPTDDGPRLTRQVSAGGSIRFGNMVTEVTYDHEEGEIEVAQENLCVSLDDDHHDAVPVPVVDSRQQPPASPTKISRVGSNGILRRSPSSPISKGGQSSPVNHRTNGLAVSDRT